MPNYNQADLLHRAISSVVKQTYQNFEIIIIDNNSSDSSKEVVNSFNNSKIKLYSINNYGIISKSRNLGILKSNGSWCCFLDADDYWFKNKLLEIKKNIENDKFVDVICNNEIYFYNDHKKFIKKIYKKKNNKLNMFNSLLLMGNQLSTSATCVKKKILKEKKIFFSEDRAINTSEDYDFWMQLAYKKANFKFINKYLGIWRIHKKSTSNKYDGHINSNLNVKLKHLENSKYNKKLKINLKKYLFFRHYIVSLKNNLNKKNFFEILKLLINIILNFKYILTFIKIKNK